MDDTQQLLLFGASTRAAAFSALRAGLQPWCVDLFADRDLTARCPATTISGKYPDGFLKALRGAPPGPWMYTGGLENHPRLVRAMSQRRELWGNNATTLGQLRDPVFVANAVREAGLPAPAVCRFEDALGPTGSFPGERCLIKSLRGVGGRGIAVWGEELPTPWGLGSYFQQFISGDSCAALFVGNGQSTRLLGLTRQLVGELFCHAAPFQYCGSIGPLTIDAGLTTKLERLGAVLTRDCGLRGLFGVDGILRDGDFFPVEVNPRYTASVEVVEYAAGLQALAWHRRTFDATASVPIVPDPSRQRSFVGKAILMARQNVVFPDNGPWNTVLETLGPLDEIPAFADIPKPGEHIKAGRPILTLFARADSLTECECALCAIASDLDRMFYKS